MSDRSQLTVSKPNSLNVRQEAFARSIAEGRSQREAYQRAGYTCACRKSNPDILVVQSAEN